MWEGSEDGAIYNYKPDLVSSFFTLSKVPASQADIYLPFLSLSSLFIGIHDGNELVIVILSLGPPQQSIVGSVLRDGRGIISSL